MSGKVPTARIILKSLSIANFNLWSEYLIISFKTLSTPQAFSSQGLYAFFQFLPVIEVGFWLSLITNSKVFHLLCFVFVTALCNIAV